MKLLPVINACIYAVNGRQPKLIQKKGVVREAQGASSSQLLILLLYFTYSAAASASASTDCSGSFS